MRKSPRSAYEASGISEQAETAYHLTLSVEPVLVTDVFEWTISDSEAVTMTLRGDREADLVCNKPFSTQIVVTVTSTSNPNLTATCTLDYLKRVSNLGLKTTTIALSKTLTEYNIEASYTLSEGTIDPVIKLTNGTIGTCGLLSANGNYYEDLSGVMDFNNHGKVNIVDGKFSLIMSETERSSFLEITKGAETPALKERYFVYFVKQVSEYSTHTGGYIKDKTEQYEVSVVKLFTGQANAGEIAVAVVAIIVALAALGLVCKVLSYVFIFFRWTFSFLNLRGD